MRRFALSAAPLALFVSSTALANPDLIQGTWVEITPPAVTTGAPETCIGQGVQIDTQNPSTIYWGNTPYQEGDGGVFKSTDGGSTWDKVATVAPVWQGANDYLSMPVHVRVDPGDGQHLYAVDGVRGSSLGFFVSHDGGENFVMPQGFLDVLDEAGIQTRDLYDVAVNPTNFEHLLVSFHGAWAWESAEYGYDAGILESTDGGDSWTAHVPIEGWGAGHSIKFLYDPALGIGDANTWLLGTQGDGFWRTTDAGDNWTKVSDVDITHGGGTIYYASSGVLYASGLSTLRSTDNGATWSNAGPGSSWGIHGDGETLYTGGSFNANQPFKTSAESDGLTWTDYNSQVFFDGPYEMVHDTTNGILYSSNWTSGLWALKVGEGTGVIPDPPEPPASGGSNSSGGSTAGGNAGSGGGAPVAAAGSTAGGSLGSAGTATSGGSVATTSGGSGVGNPADGAARPGSEAGCACRVGHSRGPRSLGALIGVALALSILALRRATTRFSPAKSRRCSSTRTACGDRRRT
jgi:hypothetical protein